LVGAGFGARAEVAGAGSVPDLGVVAMAVIVTASASPDDGAFGGRRRGRADYGGVRAS
jgi:hypothetical protein